MTLLCFIFFSYFLLISAKADIFFHWKYNLTRIKGTLIYIFFFKFGESPVLLKKLPGEENEWHITIIYTFNWLCCALFIPTLSDSRGIVRFFVVYTKQKNYKIKILSFSVVSFIWYINLINTGNTLAWSVQSFALYQKRLVYIDGKYWEDY